MVTRINQDDIAFLLEQVIAGATPVIGTDPFSMIGIRTIDGTFNNITNTTIVDQHGNTVDTDTFANVDQPFIQIADSAHTVAGANIYSTLYGQTLSVLDDGTSFSSPRQISNLIVDMNPDTNPAVGSDVIGNPGDGLVSPPTNAIFTFFGQFFDHGLDFINKGGSGLITIPLPPGDPLEGQSPAGDFMFVNRATLGPPNGPLENTSSSAPLIEQSQTYGQRESTTFYLKEYVLDGSDPRGYSETGRLVTNADGTMATWADIKENALIAGITLTDAHVLNLPDPVTMALTGQAFIADIAHTANPSDGMGGVLPEDPDVGIAGNAIAVGMMGQNLEYDNELLDLHKVAGDPRANENLVLTAIHTAFHSEHNRFVLAIQDQIDQRDQVQPGFAAQWDGEKLFQAAKLINEMQYQHFAFEEFGRRLSPNISDFAQYDVTINPNITAEFSQAIYRLGHSMLTDTVRTANAADQVEDMTLIEAFLNPIGFDAVGAGALIEGQTRQQMNLIDEHVVDAVRNFLVGLPLDLAAINIARGRDVGLPTLNQLRAELFAQTGESTLAPYTSWTDFGANMLHLDSLVNFIAAYTRAGDAFGIAAARVLGDNDLARANAAAAMADATFMATDQSFQDIDLWIGALAEAKVIGPGGVVGMLGSTSDFIFAMQMRALQDGDRFYYLARLAGTNILDQIEGNTLGDLFERGTGARHTNGDIFSNPDEHVEISTLGGPDFTSSAGEWREVIGGTTAANIINAGAANDTVWGEAGNDTISGGLGDDHLFGQDGDDTISGGSGDDFIRGDAGDDTIAGGIGDDHIFGGVGNDIINAGQGFDEVFGGPGDDIISGGDQDDTLLGEEQNDIIDGNAGDDTIDGGPGDDHLRGSQGDDTLIGGPGNNVFIGGSGADVFDGLAGLYDLVSYPDAPIGLTIDMAVPANSTGEATNDTYIGIEELRGTPGDDLILGDAFANVLSGGGGTDVIDGGAGDDVLYDNPGFVTTLRGGAGEDEAVYFGTHLGISPDFINNAGIQGGGNVTQVAGSFVNLHNSIERVAFDDGIFHAPTQQYIPLLGLVQTTTLSVNGVELDGNVVADLILPENDGTDPLDIIPGNGIFVTDINIIDPDGNNGVLNFALSGPDAAQFQIFTPGGLPELRFMGGLAGVAKANFEVQSVFHVTVEAMDNSGGSGLNLTLNLLDINDNRPLITSPDGIYVQEGTDTSVVVYRATATDLDTVGPALAYSLAAAVLDNDLFTMVDGEVRFNASPVFAAPLDAGGDNVYNIEISAFDGVGTTTKEVTITVGNTPSFTTMPPAPFEVAENTLAAEIIYDADATSPGGSPMTFSLSGADAGLFNIDPMTGELRFNAAPDFEMPSDDNGDNTYEISIGASDGFTSTTQMANVEVTNITGNTITGTAGDDIINQFETVLGEPFPTSEEDTIIGLDGADRLSGHSGNDTLIGGLGNDVLFGGLGNDLLQGGDGIDYLVGEAGDDMLEGGAGNDSLTGRLGNDTLLGGDGNDKLVGATGFDPEGADMLDGGLGDDQLFADASDTVQGGDGRDLLIARGMVGLNVNLAAASIEETRGGDFGDVFDASGVTGLGNFVRLRGNGGDDTLIGGDGDDILYGGDHNDVLQGNAGADFLVGEANNDLLDGGTGNDKLVGGTGNDTLLGGDGLDILIGATGLDAEGADILIGGLGDDELFADASDTIQGGDGRDLLVARGPTGLNVDLAATSIEETRGGDFADVFDGSGVTAEILRLRGNGGDDTLIGGDQADELFGGLGMDLLQGNAGNDNLVGQGGNDTLEGGTGNDTLVGGAGLDMLAGGAGMDSFWSTDFDLMTDVISDYSFAEGDMVQGLSFTVVGLDTLVWDGLGGTGNTVFQLTGYDATASNITLFA